MAHEDICCGLYRGSLYLQEKGVENAPLLPVGNAEFTITTELTEIEQPNYQSLGGTNCSVSYMEAMNLEMVLHCINTSNLAKAFLGTASKLTPEAVTDEEHVVNAEHELIPFKHVPDKAVAIVVTSEDGLTTYVDGTDYKKTNAGIIILGGSIPLQSTIKVNYTYGANFRLDAATTSQKEYYAVFDGVNVGEGKETPVVMKFHKVKFAPTDSFAVITTEFASLNLNGKVLKDDSVVGNTNESKFFNAEWGQPSTGVY